MQSNGCALHTAHHGPHQDGPQVNRKRKQLATEAARRAATAIGGVKKPHRYSVVALSQCWGAGAGAQGTLQHLSAHCVQAGCFGLPWCITCVVDKH